MFHAKTFAKHLQKCFRAVDFPRLCRGCKNVVKRFILHVTTAKTIFEQFANVLQMFCDIFATVFSVKRFKNIFSDGYI